MAGESGRLVVGVDLGGTKILSLAVDAGFRVLDRDRRDTDAEGGPDSVIARMADSVRAAAAGRRFGAVGVSAAGPCDLVRGIITSPPNLPGWHDVPLPRLLSESLGAPAFMENDANAAAIAEHRLGAGRGSKHMVLVTLGTGIGGGLILDGRVYHGASGAGGEIGHMQLESKGPVCGCGRPGCLEALASGRALAARAREIVMSQPDGYLARLIRDGQTPSAETLAAAAEAGDSTSAEAIETAGRYLGAGLTNLVFVFNPEVIVIAGSLRKLGERYLGPALEVVRRESYAQSYGDVRIVEAELGDDAAAIGAALVALDGLQASRE